jgi:hypothetical protein
VQKNLVAGGYHKRKAEEMDALLDQVTNDRVFKRLADFACGRQYRSQNLITQPIPDSLEPATKDDSQIPRTKRITSDPTTIHVEASVHKSTHIFETKAGLSEISPDGTEEIAIFDGRIAEDANEALHSERKYHEKLVEVSTTGNPSVKQPYEAGNSFRPQLAENHYLEIVTYRNGRGKTNSGLTLTEHMIRQWNAIFHLEATIQRALKDMERIKRQEDELEEMITHLNERIHLPTGVGDTDRSKDVLALEEAEEIGTEIFRRKQIVGHNLATAERESQSIKSQLFSDWRKVMADHNLLEWDSEDQDHQDQPETLTSCPAPIDRPDSETSDISCSYVPEGKRKSPTASELARWAAADARDEALQYMHDKSYELRHARKKVEYWKDYYDEEYKAFCQHVADGRLQESKTYYDRIMLRSEIEATENLIKVEKEWEVARERARQLGGILNESDQESNFLDHADDGYRESMEVNIISQVDRERIQYWLAHTDDKTEPSNEWDTWDAKTVGLSDSVSLVAEGKERRRIDRWQTKCELLELEALGDA